MRNDIRIEYLAEQANLVGQLEALFVETWPPWYGPNGQGDAAADIAASMNRNRLPIALVALGRGNTLMGTAALKPDSVGNELAPGPWLAALVVPPVHRRKGVATALVAAIEDLAARLGYPALYTSTDTADPIMRARNWRSIGMTSSLRGGISVFEKTLDMTREA